MLTVDLEDPLHRVAPAAQHLPISRSQIRPTGQELVQYGLAVRQAVLKREPVDDADRFALAQLLVGIGGLEHELLQMPFEPRAEREIDQGPLQFRTALDEGGKRRLAATVVHGQSATSLLRPTERSQLAVDLGQVERLGFFGVVLAPVLHGEIAVVRHGDRVVPSPVCSRSMSGGCTAMSTLGPYRHPAAAVGNEPPCPRTGLRSSAAPWSQRSSSRRLHEA